MSLAISSRSRSKGSATPVPTSSVVVAVAATSRLAKGSIIRRYWSGMSPPDGYGVWRETGMCECSPIHSES
jgi:hypothetical protein